MVDKSELVAFEREKRLYKDAYVENFRSVRYFSSLATLGAGRTEGDSIVLVQEPQLPVAAARQPPKAQRRSKFDNVASRLIPPDSLEEMFDDTLPLTTFRSAIMCKHAKARRERQAASGTSKDALAGPPSRFRTPNNTVCVDSVGAIRSPVYLPGCNIDLVHAHDRQPGVFKPTSVVEAKGAIQRKVAYDGQPYQDKPHSVRSVTPRTCTDAPRQWAINNPANARTEICGRAFFNVPPEGPVKANRKYTQEFIRLNMETYQAGHHHAAESNERHDH
ncbi:hypothetical protein P3T76_000284 [Phytophthora citrophthora]|uniref:Uncharacterized protein n=1 Tax=Phytophthora citrophthora TaxID=4793 RepID=A0AAD9LVA5_9STRA|nr:hypothetical protein P3T76_000284 [Phytophthora citrophthora]